MAVRPYVIWKTDEPRVGEFRESPVYNIFGEEWIFCLHTYMDDVGEVWSIHQCRKENAKNSPVMTMAAYIKDRNGKLYEMRLSPINMERVSWASFCLRETRKEDLLVDGNLTFVVLFDILPQFLLEIIEKAKSAYNSVFFPCETTSCLEADFENLMRVVPPPNVKLECEGYTIAVHKPILISQSDVFEAMFRTDMLERREDSVSIVDVEFRILQLFVRYLYLGRLPNLTVEETSLLYEVADKYAVEALKKNCSNLLILHLTEENVLRLFVLADLHSDWNFKERILSYIIDVNLPSKRPLDWDEFCHYYQNLALQVLSPPLSAVLQLDPYSFMRTMANAVRH